MLKRRRSKVDQKVDLSQWNKRQLQMRSAHLHGNIDGLIANRQRLYGELNKTTEDIAQLEVLRRNVDYGNEEDATLEHLRYREHELREGIKIVGVRIEELDLELKPIDHELHGREPEVLQRMRESRHQTERDLERFRNQHGGIRLFGGRVTLKRKH